VARNRLRRGKIGGRLKKEFLSNMFFILMHPLEERPRGSSFDLQRF